MRDGKGPKNKLDSAAYCIHNTRNSDRHHPLGWNASRRENVCWGDVRAQILCLKQCVSSEFSQAAALATFSMVWSALKGSKEHAFTLCTLAPCS
jgi:hypothetical protein